MMPSKTFSPPSTNILQPFDVVVVPFPFSDLPQSKRRPALVLSKNMFNDISGHVILAMITTSKSPWPQDAPLKDYQSAGLAQRCLVRMKLFTLDTRLILKKTGKLTPTDRKAVQEALHVALL